MAVIYSYPTAASSSLSSSDLLLLSKMDANGRPTKSVTLSSLATFIGGGSALGGPFLPLTAGDTVPLTGDLYMAPNGAAASSGSKNIVFRGIDDGGTELDAARIFTTDSSANPKGQDLYIQNADDNGVLRTNIFVDAFGLVGIGKTNPSTGLDVANAFNVDGLSTFQDNVSLISDKKLNFGPSAYIEGTVAGTKIIVRASDDILFQPGNVQHVEFVSTGGVKLNSLGSYADDAAAGVGRVPQFGLYQTDGTGVAPLNVAGIVMIKQ